MNGIKSMLNYIGNFIDKLILPSKESVLKKLKAREPEYKKNLIEFLQLKIPDLKVNEILEQSVVIIPKKESLVVFESINAGKIEILNNYDSIWEKDVAQLWMEYLKVESIENHIYHILIDWSIPGFLFLKAYYKSPDGPSAT